MRSGKSRTGIVVRASLFSLLLISATSPSLSQQLSSSSRDDQETIKQLLKRVEELESRVRELESKRSATASPSEPRSDEAPAAADTSSTPSTQTGHDSSMSHGGSPSLQLRGFSDISYHATNAKGETNSFALGQLDLFMTSRISDSFSVLGELVLEANERNEFGFEIERLLLQYSKNDYFNVAVGRYHTAIGYYNTAYHHGTWFQTTTGRPFLFAFEDEGGILPIHNVGVSMNGRIPSGKLGLGYVAEIGNGRAARSRLDEPVQNVVDENNGKSFNLGLIARPDWLQGLQAGFSYYNDNLTPNGMPNIHEKIFAAHVVYQNNALELLNEGMLVSHTLRGLGQTINTAAFYTQASRKFGKARPYFRYQYVNVPDSDPVIGDAGRQNGPSVGLRFDLSEFVAFKAQYDRTLRRRLDP